MILKACFDAAGGADDAMVATVVAEVERMQGQNVIGIEGSTAIAAVGPAQDRTVDGGGR